MEMGSGSKSADLPGAKDESVWDVEFSRKIAATEVMSGSVNLTQMLGIESVTAALRHLNENDVRAQQETTADVYSRRNDQWCVTALSHHCIIYLPIDVGTGFERFHSR